MKIGCLVKFVPNVDNFKYDYEKNVIVRENSHMILNPDDSAAVAYALQLKQAHPGSHVEIISMAPTSILSLARDILRVGADKFVLLSDRMFIGSDTFATAVTISKFVQNRHYDIILSGSHSLDGSTSHVPSQLAELLGIAQLSGICKVLEINDSFAKVEVESEREVLTYGINLPAILSLVKQSGYKMPFVRYDDLDLDVDDKIEVVSGQELGLAAEETGLAGSKTVVKKTYSPEDIRRETIHVKADEAGAGVVYEFLVDKGYINKLPQRPIQNCENTP